MKVEMTADRLNQLQNVDHIVNAMPYIADMKQFGQDEFWEATGKGDCEDKAMAKMAMLRTLGWPKESLDLAVCFLKNIGHCVLVAHTSRGDMVLDNNLTKPTLWNTLPYKWLEMSQDGDFRKWVEIKR